MIVRSVFAVSCPSCDAPLALTYTLASRGDEPRADSLEISRFLPSFLGKMAVFDKTESLFKLLPFCICGKAHHGELFRSLSGIMHDAPQCRHVGAVGRLIMVLPTQSSSF